MRILYLHQYFKTPEEGGPIRSYYLGKALAEAGHEVMMLTSWNEQYLKIEQVAGMQVYYLPVPYSNNMSFIARSRAFVQYLRLAWRQLSTLVPADLVYATSTPLTIGLLALYLERRHRIPYIFEVRDLWPEAPIQLGYIQSKLVIAGLRRQEKLLYQRAAAVVALSPGIAEGVKQIHPGARLHLAPNMADCLFFSPTPKPQTLLKHWQLEGKFVISYTGAAGVANHLDYLIAAARACEEAALPVHFLVAAQGSQLAALQQQALGLPNILFLPYGSKAVVRDYLSVSDAVYTSFGQHAVLQSCSPNKFFDGLAAGKLCLVNVKGWLKELVESEQCGFYAPPETPEQFVAKLRPYLQDPRLLQQAQANARRTAEAHFSRQQVSAGVVALVERVVRAT